MESAPAAGLGDVLLQKGLITPDQLDTALEQQRATGRALGEFLVANGWLRRLDLAGVFGELWQNTGSVGSAETARPLPRLWVVPPQNELQTAPEAPFDPDAPLGRVQTELEQTNKRALKIPWPVTRPSSFLAFAPTRTGYRLVECQGTSPRVGDRLELLDCDGPLIVSRLGRSPLPADARPCAYLQRSS